MWVYKRYRLTPNVQNQSTKAPSPQSTLLWLPPELPHPIQSLLHLQTASLITHLLSYPYVGSAVWSTLEIQTWERTKPLEIDLRPSCSEILGTEANIWKRWV